MADRHIAEGLRYWRYGHGRRGTALLVHGWLGHHEFMAPIARHLAVRGHRVLAVDMPGHGDSPPPPDGYGVEQLAARLRAFAVALDLRDVVVIGHSLGGVWSLAAASADRERFAGLVLLDSAVAGPPGAADGVEQVARSLRHDTSGVVRESIVRSYFLPESEPQLVEWTVTEMARPDTEVAHEPIAGLAAYLRAEGDIAALRRWDRPLLFVGSNAPFADYDRLVDVAPRARIGQAAGSGHFTQLEVPIQTNAMISRHLQLSH